MVLPPSLQSSLPAGWLAFTGRELNPLDRYKRFQITFPSSFSGFVLAQGKFHFEPPTPFTSLCTPGGNGITTHGFRSAFRDWAGDNTPFPREVAEAALAHAVGNKVERSYRRVMH